MLILASCLVGDGILEAFRDQTPNSLLGAAAQDAVIQTPQNHAMRVAFRAELGPFPMSGNFASMQNANQTRNGAR